MDPKDVIVTSMDRAQENPYISPFLQLKIIYSD